MWKMSTTRLWMIDRSLRLWEPFRSEWLPNSQGLRRSTGRSGGAADVLASLGDKMRPKQIRTSISVLMR